MNQSDLIFSIVLDNADAFHYLSAQEIITVMTSCKEAYNNEPLQNMRNKHRALYLYYKAWNVMNEAYFALKHYHTSADLDLSRRLFVEHKELVKTFEHETYAVKDCLSRILLAEYKELLYDIVYGQISNSTYYDYEFLIQQFKYEMLEKLSFCNMTCIHDPTHYAFMDIEKTFYQFYNNIEKQGKNILEDSKCVKFFDMIEGRYEESDSSNDNDSEESESEDNEL